MRPDFAELEAEALAAPFSGWDFSWLDRRSVNEPLPWSYRQEVARYSGSAAAMLDMGTGGGEVLSRLRPRPARTVATEAWPPNVPVAAARLRPLGIPVVQDDGAPGNAEQAGQDGGRLPFKDGAFGLVINRHEAFRATEVSRVLAPGGIFVTQQVDYHNDDDLRRLLDLEIPAQQDSWLPLAQRQLGDAGLEVVTAVAGEERHHLTDVAAVIYYLRVVSWAIPEYSLARYRERLRSAWAAADRWPVTIRPRRFLLVSRR
jgi:SAM-dependent methyltransferase